MNTMAHYFWDCTYFFAIVSCGLLRGTYSQNDEDCRAATTRSDFKIFKNSCFWKSSLVDKRTRSNAQTICSAFGGNLATVQSQETLNFLHSTLSVQSDTEYWIGLYRYTSDIRNGDNLQDRRQSWKWLDRTSYDYRNGVGWLNLEPEGNDVLGLLRNRRWMATEASATITFSFICETKLSLTTTQSTRAFTTFPWNKFTRPWQITPLPTRIARQPREQQPMSTATPSTLSPYSSGANSACRNATNYDAFKFFEDTCYWTSPQTETRLWQDAQSVCSSFGGNLATVTRQETVDFLKANWAIESSAFWIGLYTDDSVKISRDDINVRKQADWKWKDGTRFDRQNGLGWSIQEPFKEGNVGLLFKLKWAASIYTYKTQLPYICATKLPNATPPTPRSSSSTVATTASTLPSTTAKPTTMETTSTTLSSTSSSTTPSTQTTASTTQTTASTTPTTASSILTTSQSTFSTTSRIQRPTTYLPPLSKPHRSSTHPSSEVPPSNTTVSPSEKDNSTKTSSSDDQGINILPRPSNDNRPTKNYAIAALGVLIVPVIAMVVGAIIHRKRKHKAQKDEPNNDDKDQHYADITALEPETGDEVFYQQIVNLQPGDGERRLSSTSDRSSTCAYVSHAGEYEQPVLATSTEQDSPVSPSYIELQTKNLSSDTEYVNWKQGKKLLM